MKFAPEKSIVIASDEIELFLGESRLPQATSSKYLGIPFTPKGPDWTSAAMGMAKKAKGVVIMALDKCGFNKTSWAPAAKIDVYKLFIRSQMEYRQESAGPFSD